jgi:hypothetical protein
MPVRARNLEQRPRLLAVAWLWRPDDVQCPLDVRTHRRGDGSTRHHVEMAAVEIRVVLVDDLRSFIDGRPAEIARTSKDGVRLLDQFRDQRLDELWLDHDLGQDDTIWPVVEVLERAAFDGRPLDIGVVNIHSANPAGVTKMAQALRRWGYRVRIASGSAEVGYIGVPTTQ